MLPKKKLKKPEKKSIANNPLDINENVENQINSETSKSQSA